VLLANCYSVLKMPSMRLTADCFAHSGRRIALVFLRNAQHEQSVSSTIFQRGGHQLLMSEFEDQEPCLHHGQVFGAMMNFLHEQACGRGLEILACTTMAERLKII